MAPGGLRGTIKEKIHWPAHQLIRDAQKLTDKSREQRDGHWRTVCAHLLRIREGVEEALSGLGYEPPPE